MRRHLAMAAILILASIAVVPSAASAETPIVIDASTAFGRATVYSKTIPGMEFVGENFQAAVVNTPTGPLRLSTTSDLEWPVPLPGATNVGIRYVNYCDSDRFAMAYFEDLLYDGSATDLNLDEIVSCASTQWSAFLVGVLDGEPIARRHAIDNGVLNLVGEDLPIAAPISVENVYGGQLFTSVGGEVIFSNSSSFEPWESSALGAHKARAGDQVTEYGFEGTVIAEYSVPANSVDIISWFDGRAYIQPDGAGGSSLEMVQVKGYDEGVTRRLPLPMVPERVIRQSGQTYVLFHADTMTTVKDEIVVAFEDTVYDQNSGDLVTVQLWEPRPFGRVYLLEAGGLRAAIQPDVIHVDGGVAFQPPLVESGDHAFNVSNSTLWITITGQPVRVPVQVQIHGDASVSNNVNYLSCEHPDDPERTHETHSGGTVWGGDVLTFQVLTGSDCSASANFGSWGEISDGVLYDWRGEQTEFKNIDQPMTLGLYSSWAERPLWIVASRSGGAVVETREVSVECWRSSNRTHHEVVQLTYDQPVRVGLPSATSSSMCFVFADDGPQSDLTAGYQWQDEHELPVTSNRGGVQLVGNEPAWIEIVDLVVHPLDDNVQFVEQQHTDFLGRSATPTESYGWATDISSGAQTRGALVTGLLNSIDFKTIADPNVRLYQAYFGRLPDAGGLRYWMDVRTGGYSIDLVSEQFTLSQEFINTYGNSTDREFIRLVYVNVLDREPDADGYAYWLDLMDAGLITRGQLMINFSESAEYRNAWESRVRVVGAYIALLDRIPTAAELILESGRLAAGQGIRPLVDAIISGAEYEQRFWDHYRGPRITDQTAGHGSSALVADSVPVNLGHLVGPSR